MVRPERASPEFGYPEHSYHAATTPPASAFERVLSFVVEEPSDSIPAFRSVTVFSVIGGSVLIWAAIAITAWRAFA